MHRKTYNRIKSRSMSHLLSLASCLTITFFIVGCSCGNHSDVSVRQISIDSLRIMKADMGKVNWLDGHGWDSVLLTSKSDRKRLVQAEMAKIRYYAQGALSVYNSYHGIDDPNVPYHIVDFAYAVTQTSPLQASVIVYLNPPATKDSSEHHHEQDQRPARPVGSHILPPPPPPPGK